MNPFTIFIIYLLFLTSILYAQEPDLTFEDLKAPSMPSATIIGIQANEVNKPKSMKELESAVFSNYLDSEKGLTIPNNYALEFNPFMLSSRKNFNYLDYLENEICSNILKNFSVSVSSTNDFFINDTTTSNALGFGFRTIIFNGKPKEEIKESYINALNINQRVLDINTKVRTLISAFKSEKDTAEFNLKEVRSFIFKELEKDSDLINPKDSTGNILSGSDLIVYQKSLKEAKEYVKVVLNEVGENVPLDEFENVFTEIYDRKISEPGLDKLREELKNVKYKRFGIRMEADLAFALSFPTNEFNNCISPKWGFWTNISYKPENFEEYLFIGLARVIFNNEDFYNRYNQLNENIKTGNIYDFGSRVVYEYKKISFELEYIYRINSNKIVKIINGDKYERKIEDNTNKYLLNLNYNISNNINVAYSIGKSFDNISKNGGNFISGLSINFGFGDIKVDELLSKE
jgi:hypothetical protein